MYAPHKIFYRYLIFKKITTTKSVAGAVAPQVKSGSTYFGYEIFNLLFLEQKECNAIDLLLKLRAKFIEFKINPSYKLAFFFYLKYLGYLDFIKEDKYSRTPPKKGAALFAYMIFNSLIINEDEEEAINLLIKQRIEITNFTQNLVNNK